MYFHMSLQLNSPKLIQINLNSLSFFLNQTKKSPISNNVLKVEFFTKESIGKQLNIEYKFENESLKHKVSYGIVN